MKEPKRILIAGYVTRGLVAQKDVRIARDDKDWVFIAERWADCPVNSQVRHHRTWYRNCHGLFLKEKTHGGCNCSRKHWHVLPLAEAQKLKKAADKAKWEEEKVLRKENRLAFKRTMASGAFSLGL